MTTQYLIIDAHEDMAWNMLSFGRDYSRCVAETRRLEKGLLAPSINGDTLLGWDEYQKGHIAVVFSTLFAAPRIGTPPAWDWQTYSNAEEAHFIYWNQLEHYHRFIDQHPNQFRLIENRNDLAEIIAGWSNETDQANSNEKKAQPQVGMLVLMEGAEGVRNPGELEQWKRFGVRIIGPAWRGTRFCGGTGQPGPMTREGWELLKGMEENGLALDISHMDEQAALQVLDSYPGQIIASHANARSLLKGTESNRHLRDRTIEKLVERKGVMGVVLNNPFLLTGWAPADGKQAVPLQMVVDQIDYICQLAGDASHVGLGSDFDGGFGLPSTPAEIDTIADLQRLVPKLQQKGYSDENIAAIMGNNWLKILEEVLL